MKPITLYTANEQSVMSYDMNYLQQYRHIGFDQLTPVYNSDILIAKESMVEVVQLPIHRFCWSSGKEIFAAFDEQLQELIGISQAKFKQDVQTATDSRVKREHSALLQAKSELETLQSMNLWHRLGWAIRKIWQ